MPTPTEQQARNQHAQQAAIAAAGSAAVAAMVAQSLPWAQVLQTFAAYQLAAASQVLNAFGLWARRTPRVDPRAFAGVTSHGYSIAEPLIAAIDAKVEAPAQAIPAPWWKPDDIPSLIKDVARVVEAEIKDAARAAASVAITEDDHWRGYIRMLVPPSCKRCAVLAGKIYRFNEGFSRHPPTCDCIHVPLAERAAREAEGLIADPEDLFRSGQIRDLTQAETAALEDGASVSEVVNAASGMYTAEVFGRRVKATWTGTTKRAAWRRANPSQRVRLRPEAIYKIVNDEHGGDRRVARRLLQRFGYITGNESGTDDPSRGFGEPPAGKRGDPEFDQYWDRRRAALPAEFNPSVMLPPLEVEFAERMHDLGEDIRWIDQEADKTKRRGKNGELLPVNDFHWGSREWEHKGIEPTTPVDAVHIARQVTKATKKGKTNVVVDVGNRSLPAGTIDELRSYNLNADRMPVDRLQVMAYGRLYDVALHPRK